MYLLVTGGTGVLGRAFLPLAEAGGHLVSAPGRTGLDLFDPLAVAAVVRGADAVLRLGLLDGPGTGHDQPNPGLGATLHTEDAGRALLEALTAPSGIYNVCRDGERVRNRHFADATGWHPLH